MKKIALNFLYIFIPSIIFFASPAFCTNFDCGSAEYDDQNIYDIIIIGAGFSGAYTALELAKDGYKILVLEKNSQTIGSNSSSFNQCYKLHSGLHYFGDPETAKKCLINSVIFAKQWSSCLLGEPGTPIRRNRHYIMSNSLFNSDSAETVSYMLSETYANLVKEDPTNKVFGEPSEFIKKIENPEEYPHVAKKMVFPNSNETHNVVLALDVAEPQIDIKKMRIYLDDSITNTSNINALFDHKVVDIIPWKDNENNLVGYNVTAYSEEGIKEFKAKSIINCSWHKIEELNKKANIYSKNPDDLLIRTKVSILVKLPPKIKNIESSIFSAGPFCSITNQYDGTAILTYEPVTNQKFSYPEHRFVSVAKENQEIAQQIIEGCAIFIKEIGEISKEEPKEIRIGQVKMYVGQGEVYSIHTKESPIHKRRESGIEVNREFPLYMSISGIKMTYTHKNAIDARNIVKESRIKPSCNLLPTETDWLLER